MIDFTRYIRERVGTFTGRAWIFHAIHQWLTRPEGTRYFLLTGEPGCGKTALAARLSQFSQGEAPPPETCAAFTAGFLSAVHFCFARDSAWVSPVTFTRSLAQQLLARYPEVYTAAFRDALDIPSNIRGKAQAGTVHAGAVVAGVYVENLFLPGLNPQEVFNRCVRNPLQKLYTSGFDSPITILVDSLDEALSSEQGVTIVDLLSNLEQLPPQVRFILTSRPEPRVENKFLAASRMSLSDLAYTSENNKDIADYVEHRIQHDDRLTSKVAALSPAKAAALWALITAKASGNFQYVRFFLDAVTRGQQSIQELEGLPPRLDGLYADSLGRVVRLGKKDWSKAYAPLMGVLSVVQESLTLTQLKAFIHRSQRITLGYLSDLQQFIETVEPSIGQPQDCGRYQLYHQSMVDFLSCPSIRLENETLRNPYYLPPDEWHQQILGFYRRKARKWSEMDWGRIDNYGLNHLATHLHALRDEAKYRTELYALICEPFMRQKRRRYGSHQSFAADVTLAIEALHMEPQPDQVLQVVRLCLISATLRSLSTNIPPQIIGALTLVGQQREALGFAALLEDAYQQFEAYMMSVYALLQRDELQEAHSVMTQALTAVDAMDNEQKKAHALTWAAKAIVGAIELEPLLEKVDAIASSAIKVAALCDIAQVLVPAGEQGKAIELINRACSMAAAIEDGDQTWHSLVWNSYEMPAKADAFYRIIYALSQLDCKGTAAEVVKQLTEFLGRISDPETKARTLVMVINALNKTGERTKASELVTRELAIVKQMANQEHKASPRLMASMAYALAQAGEFALSRAVAEMINDEDEQVSARMRLAESLAQANQLEQALAILNTITDESRKANGTFLVVRAMLNLGRYHEALAAAESISSNQFWRSMALSRAVQAMAQAGDIEQAQRVSEAITHREYRAEAQSALAQTLAQAEQLDQALGVTQQIAETRTKAATISTMLERLIQRDDQVRAKEITYQELLASETVGDQESMVSALCAMALALAKIGKKARAIDVANWVLTVAQETRDQATKAFRLIDAAELWIKLEENCRATDIINETVAIAQTIEENDDEGKSNKAYVLSNIAQAWSHIGEFDLARRMVAEIQLKGVKAEAFSEIAKALALTGELDQAVAMVQDERSASSGDELLVVAEALAKAGQFDRAQMMAKQIVDTATRMAMLSTIHWYLTRAGQMNAARVLEKRIEEMGAEITVYNYYALRSLVHLLCQMGRFDEALERCAAVEEKGVAFALAAIAEALAKAGQKERALEVARQALGAVELEWPSDRDYALVPVALAFAAAGDASKALTVIETIGDTRSRTYGLAAVTQTLIQRAEHGRLLSAWISELLRARFAGRQEVFLTLAQGAVFFASIAHGQILWELCRIVQNLEEWWKIEKSIN